MTTLEDLFPLEQLRQAVPDAIVTIRRKPDFQQIRERDPETIRGIALNVGNRVVQRELIDDVSPIAGAIAETDPDIYDAVVSAVGHDIIADIVHIEATVSAGANKFDVAKFVAANVYPNDLHLADVLIQDPTKPIPAKDRIYPHQQYHGFGLLPAIIENAETFAREKQKDFITLTAASRDLVSLFQKYGFKLEPGSFSQLAYSLIGKSIPMEKLVPRRRKKRGG